MELKRRRSALKCVLEGVPEMGVKIAARMDGIGKAPADMAGACIISRVSAAPPAPPAGKAG